MTDLRNVLAQLHRDRSRAQPEASRLDEAIASITRLIARGAFGVRRNGRGPGRKVSSAARARIAAAQRARWAKARQSKSAAAQESGAVRTVSKTARNKMAAAQSARWAKVKQRSVQPKQRLQKKST